MPTIYRHHLCLRKDIVLQIYILLTENCNLNCAMCIRGKQQGIQMDIAKLQELIDKNDFSSHDIVLTGGEPTLHRHFVDIVRLMCCKAKTVTVTSNGTNDLHIQDLLHLPNLYYQISLDGDAEAHNRIRGNDAYERTWNNLIQLDHAEARYSVASVVSNKNKIEIFNLISELGQLSHMRYWRISYEMPFGSAGFEKMMSADEWNTFVSELLHRADFKVKVQKIFPFDLYDQRREELDQLPAGHFRSINCGSGKNKVYVYPDFKVYPCTCLTDFCIGELDKQTLDEILDAEPVKRFTDYKLLDDSVCKSCEYRKYCNGGCIGMSYHFFGKLGMGDKRCPKLNKE